jgi:hypothetical protein
MRINRRTIGMVGIVVIQLVFLIWANRDFKESMDERRDVLEREVVAGGMPQQQVQALSTAMRGVKLEISNCLVEIGWLLQSTTLVIFALTSKEGSKEARRLDTEREA